MHSWLHCWEVDCRVPFAFIRVMSHVTHSVSHVTHSTSCSEFTSFHRWLATIWRNVSHYPLPCCFYPVFPLLSQSPSPSQVRHFPCLPQHHPSFIAPLIHTLHSNISPELHWSDPYSAVDLLPILWALITIIFTNYRNIYLLKYLMCPPKFIFIPFFIVGNKNHTGSFKK